MRMLQLITRAEPGGAQVHLLSLLRGLARQIEITLVTGEEGFLTARARPLGIQVRVIRELIQPIDPNRDVPALLQIIRVIRASHPGLLHAHTSKAGFLGRLAARLCGVPAIFTAHGWQFADGHSVGRRLACAPLERLATVWGMAIINVCEADRDLAIRRRIGGAAGLHVIHNGLEDDGRRASPGSGPRATVVMVARFAPPKDYELLLRASSELNVGFDLILVGDGPGRAHAERLVERLGMRDRVQFLGRREDVAEILARAHVFVLASRAEGLPISVLEAMRAGLPVIATDVGGVREAVSEGETGFLVPPGDAAVLRERLTRLVANPEMRSRMGEAGRMRFIRNFTVDRAIERTLTVYEHVLGFPLKRDREGNQVGAAVPGPGRRALLNTKNDTQTAAEG